MADDPWAKFNPQKPDDWSKFSPEATPSEPSSNEPGTLKSFAGGVAQGAIFDPVTGINQLIEHASNNKVGLPDSVKKWLDDYKEKYTSGTAGTIGRGVGTIGSFLIPGGAVARGAGMIPKAVQGARALTGMERALMGSIAGAAGGTVQPVDESEGDFGKQKAAQTILGGVGGGLLGSPGGGAGLSALAIKESADHFGWPATLVGLSFLTPTLHGLATHHQGWQAARFLSDKANLLVNRPGATYAAGRAAGAIGGPAGATVLDQTEQ